MKDVNALQCARGHGVVDNSCVRGKADGDTHEAVADVLILDCEILTIHDYHLTGTWRDGTTCHVLVVVHRLAVHGVRRIDRVGVPVLKKVLRWNDVGTYVDPTVSDLVVRDDGVGGCVKMYVTERVVGGLVV